ncbi:helix-turn-helix domain-containing protein [Romeria aff. gracilis LEGE 07310]|uniref:Helix-turn-helix domain-containing protein n=1 Tax=Vasconcelosia minhoensis LEGE 07310 TaxID=915328 RepID=A0A8J7DE26_9CYAN|nr:helix-turn-helix domain-containing protein [Romeria aff. gracilis LEGE 07310]
MDPSADYSDWLRSRLQSANLKSFRALAAAAGVSRWQVQQLRQGRVAQMRLAPLQQLAQALNLTLAELLGQFEPQTPEPAADEIETLRQEYARLQAQTVQQQGQARSQLQREALQTLETWLVQWPTAAHAAQANEQIPAQRLLPLVRPVETLMQNWDVQPIGTVGAEIPYDPQQHQLMSGTAQPGDPVRVRYVGFTHSQKLIQRAKVSPLTP